MRTFLACIVMLSFLLGFTDISRTTTMAENVRDKAKEPKKTGKIVITEGGDAKFRFFVWDSDGNLLAMSGLGGFATEKEAKETIDSLKEVLARAKVSTMKSEK
jgi:hypothetical protein